MNIEFGIYDDLIESSIREKVFKAVENISISGIAIHQFAIPYIINFLPESKTLSCPIDWPFGLSLTKVRNFITLNTLHQKVKAIDLVISPHLMVDKNKFQTFIADIQSHIEMCKKNNVELRAMIDSRHLSMDTFNEIFVVFRTMGIETCIIGTSHFVDDFSDDILMCKLIESHYGMRSILNMKCVTEKQLESVFKFNVFGLRLNNNLAYLDLLSKFSGVYSSDNSTQQDQEIFD